MGNSSSRDNKNISPGEDALNALRNPSTGRTDTSISADNTIFLNESFLSLDLSAHGDECWSPEKSGIGENVPYQEESAEHLNFKNLHVSFLASFICDSSHASRSQPLIDVVKSHRWSVQSQEYVSMCASFILSIIKIYGQCIPQDSRVINQKSYLMFHILDELYEYLSNMKRNNWHVDTSLTSRSTCLDCEVNQMVWKHVNLVRTMEGDKFCLVCLQFVHDRLCQTDSHIQLRTRLLEDIYPFFCLKCEMRFCKEQDLLLHSSKHHQDSAVENNDFSFKPSCCFLCRVPCDDTQDLERHQKMSFEHACRKEIAMELALRCTGVVLESLPDSNHNGEAETNMSSTMSTVPINILLNKHNVTDETTILPCCKVSEKQYYCSPCAVYVPKANVINHERGQKHHVKCEEWSSNSFKHAHISKNPVLQQNDICPSKNKSTRDECDDNCKTADYMHKEGIDQQIEAAIGTYLRFDKENVRKCEGQYVCTKCSVEGNIYSIFNHVMKKHETFAQWRLSEEELRLAEKKLHTLSFLLFLCVDKQKYSELKLINMAAVKRLADIVSSENSKNKFSLGVDNDLPIDVSSSKPEGKIKELDTSIDKAFYFAVDGITDGNCNTGVETLKGKLVETHNTSSPDYEDIHSIGRGKEGTSKAFNKFNCDMLSQKIEENFSPKKDEKGSSSLPRLELSVEGGEGGFDKCITRLEQNSPLSIVETEDLKNAGTVILSVSAERFKQSKDDILLSVNPELTSPVPSGTPSETTSFVQGAICNPVTDQNVIEAIEQYYQLDELVKVDLHYQCRKCKANCVFQVMLTHVLGKGHLKRILKTQTKNVLEGKLEILGLFALLKMKSEVLKYVDLRLLLTAQTAIRQIISSKSFSLSPPGTPHTRHNVKLKDVTAKFLLSPSKANIALPENTQDNYVHPKKTEASSNTVVIGDSTSTSLLEQVQEVYGTDLSDVEVECGTCGVVFQMFNDDIDLSLDMHIQNAPQHTLATAIPVERDAQSVSELSKTTNTPALSKPKGSEASKSESQAEGRKTVIAAVLSLEQTFFTSEQSCFHCKLCNVAVKTESQTMHHLLSAKHLSTKWMNCHTNEELKRKCQKFSSLLKYKYACLPLTTAISIIKAKLNPSHLSEATSSKCLSSKSLPSSATLNTKVFVPSKGVRLGNPPIANASISHCATCNEDLRNFSKKRRKSHRNTCKLQHVELKGTSEAPSNASKSDNLSAPPSAKKLPQTSSKQGSDVSKSFFCQVCHLRMHQNNKESHLSGYLHKSNLSALFASLAHHINSMST